MPRWPKLDKARAYLVSRKGLTNPKEIRKYSDQVIAMTPREAVHALYEPVEGDPWFVPEKELQAQELYGPWLPSEEGIMKRIARLHDTYPDFDYDHIPTRERFYAKFPNRKRLVPISGWTGEGYGYDPYEEPIRDLLEMQGHRRPYDVDFLNQDQADEYMVDLYREQLRNRRRR